MPSCRDEEHCRVASLLTGAWKCPSLAALLFMHGLLLQFDEAMNKALEKEVTTKTTFKGHLDSYRFCDQVPVPSFHTQVLAP